MTYDLNFVIDGEHTIICCDGNNILKDVIQKKLTELDKGEVNDFYISFDDYHYKGENIIYNYIKNKEDRMIFVLRKNNVKKLPQLLD